MSIQSIVGLSDYDLAAIAENLANDDGLPTLATLSRTCKRMRAICAPLIAQHFEESEARVDEDERGNREYFDEEYQRHRYKGQSAVIYADGRQEWWQHGIFTDSTAGKPNTPKCLHQ